MTDWGKRACATLLAFEASSGRIPEILYLGKRPYRAMRGEFQTYARDDQQHPILYFAGAQVLRVVGDPNHMRAA